MSNSVDRNLEQHAESISAEIKAVAEGMRAALRARLSRRALILLIQDAAGAPTLSRQAIERALLACERLDTEFLVKARRASKEGA